MYIKGDHAKGQGISTREFDWPTVNFQNELRTKPGVYKAKHEKYGEAIAMVYTEYCEVHFLNKIQHEEGEHFTLKILEDLIENPISPFLEVMHIGFQREIDEWKKSKTSEYFLPGCYEYTKEYDDELKLYKYTAKFDDNLFEVYVGECRSEKNSWVLSFKINDQSDYMTGFNNFRVLYATLLKMTIDFLAHEQPNIFYYSLNTEYTFGEKAEPIYKRLTERKWKPALGAVGYDYGGSEKDDEGDITFKWVKHNP